MFKYIKETDKYGKQQVKYYLTQGDSLVLYARAFKNGEPIPFSQIEKCIFKLSSISYEKEFEKELVGEGDKYVLRLSSEETKSFEAGSHIYEIEYTLLGGAVQTPNQWKFIVLDQIV